MTRKEIQDKISANKVEINKLRAENSELIIQNLLLCDETQWYSEQEVDVIIRKRPKQSEKRLHGYIHWKEDFKDEDTEEVITIERCELVRVNGEWA